jgi:hypothetical protein
LIALSSAMAGHPVNKQSCENCDDNPDPVFGFSRWLFARFRRKPVIGRNVLYGFLQAHDDRAERWLSKREIMGVVSSVSILTGFLMPGSP